ncbi:MAG: packaged DNA stabilization protein [Sterolibacterium sp.]
MRIPVFGLGQAAKSPFVTAKMLQNVYAETRPQGEKSSMVGYQTPGLELFTNFGATPCRGGMEFAPLDVCFVVHRGVLWEVNNAGVQTNRGTLLTTTGRVSMADNGTQIMIVDGTYGYIYNTVTNVFAQITHVDYPANAVTVTFLAGRFIINQEGSSRFWWSDLYDGLTWDALNFANAETNPDPIVAVWSSNGQLILEGSVSAEYWGQSGVADQPFALIQGTATEWGLAARWSVAKYDNSIAMLVKNRMGQVMVAQLSGYLPKKISTVDMDSIINGYTSVSDASAYSYMLGGHPMYVISFPSAGYTWLYDGSTGIWTSLKSFGITRHVAEFGFSYINSTVVADYNSGQLYRLKASSLTDNGVSIERSITSETITLPGLERLTVDKFRVDVEVGVGTTSGQGVNPQIGLEVSRDNGKTWGAQMWQTLGAIGAYAFRVEWRRLGTAYNFVFRLTVTDPVPLVLVSASVNPDD